MIIVRSQWGRYNLPRLITGWWFGTFGLFFHPVENVITPTGELIFFRGVGIPPTSCMCLDHPAWHESCLLIRSCWRFHRTIEWLYIHIIYIYRHIYIYTDMRTASLSTFSRSQKVKQLESFPMSLNRRCCSHYIDIRVVLPWLPVAETFYFSTILVPHQWCLLVYIDISTISPSYWSYKPT